MNYKTHLPETSHEANKRATLEMRQSHWNKIIDALEVLKLATGEQISKQSGLDYHAVMRRIGEMERNEMVYKPGGKLPTSTGRNAYQYALRTPTTVLPQKEHYMEGQISAADYASSIIAKTKHQKLIQKDLFERE